MSIVLVIYSLSIKAQQCSPEVLAAKYWEYRKNFNRHFIVIDRTSQGCVGDGIGQEAPGSCTFSKAGYSLPATGINMSPNGHIGLLHKGRGITDDPVNIWEDVSCAGSNGISWDNSKHNYLDMGSETPHQMGWYWVVLATEYELLKRSGQDEEAQRTLEEIFLGLQAYRRLDMQAQCMVQKRYEEIIDGFEVEDCGQDGDCLCGERYWEGGHENFGEPCYHCNYSPQLDGYSGFYLREDATQALESPLHDDSEDKYNIDLVASDYAMSLNPPCTTIFSQPCYLVHRQNFMSQDGMTGLLLGLAMIKRYIPENAEVTTCDGIKYKPAEMATKITSALVNRVDNSYLNRITWPLSNNCCFNEVYFSEYEGGRLLFTIKGFKKAASYIDGGERHSDHFEHKAWKWLTRQVMTSYNTNAKFWLRLKAIGWDMGNDIGNIKTLFESACETQNLEILMLMNNLLHPGGNNLQTDQALFTEFLCSAPCEGPCRKHANYPGDQNPVWPLFNCSNTPRWQGQGWETGGDNGNDRQFNGLDFMALYNIYMLHYDQNLENYYNPERPPSNAALGAGHITGPDILCTDQTAYYEAQPFYAPGDLNKIYDIHWSGTGNLQVFNPNDNGTDVKALSGASPSFLDVNFMEERTIPLYWADGTPRYTLYYGENGWYSDQANTSENCAFMLRKPIITRTPVFHVEAEYEPCRGLITFTAVSDEYISDDLDLNWTFTDQRTGIVRYDEGQKVYLAVHDNLGPATLDALLTISGVCLGNDYVTGTYVIYDCPDENQERQLVAFPNPAGNNLSVLITKDYVVNSEGLNVFITRADGGPQSVSTRIYNNGDPVNVSTLSEGSYIVQTVASDLQALSAMFIISRN